LLAVVASSALSTGLYVMKRQAERLPSLQGGWRWAAWWAFICDPLWLLGVALQVCGYGLYLTALRGAALSVVHTALNGGIVLFVLLAVAGLGERVRPVEWLGVSCVVLGLIALGVSLTADAPPNASVHGILLFAVAVVGLAVLGLALDASPGRA